MRLFRRHLDPADLGLSLLDTPDASTASHLDSCAQCRRRRDRLAARLEASRAGARAAADAAFSAADLEQQRHAILQRIARLGAAARVLPFPAGVPAAPRPASTSSDRRWVMVAAAAGLILGIAVGRLPGTPQAPGVVAQNAAAPRLAVAEPLPADPRWDETLLSDVEEELTREIRPEFEALDGLTPIAYEPR